MQFYVVVSKDNEEEKKQKQTRKKKWRFSYFHFLIALRKCIRNCAEENFVGTQEVVRLWSARWPLGFLPTPWKCSLFGRRWFPIKVYKPFPLCFKCELRQLVFMVGDTDLIWSIGRYQKQELKELYCQLLRKLIFVDRRNKISPPHLRHHVLRNSLFLNHLKFC